MAVIKQTDSAALVREAIVLDLGDLARQAETLKSSARSQAEAIVAAARAEREKLVSTAAAEGRKAGHAQGREEGSKIGREEGRREALAQHSERLDALAKEWGKALDVFLAERERMLIEARQDVLELAIAIARRITGRIAERDRGVVADQLSAVLSQLVRPTRLIIRVHPSVEAVAREALPGLVDRLASESHAELAVDPGLAPGACVARSAGGGVIDASILTQLDRIAQELVPGADATPTTDGAVERSGGGE